ncbi:MAG TPA: T9SS type A sorting domain-containing protein [Candidatus Eisenbacteria bacterium]
MAPLHIRLRATRQLASISIACLAGTFGFLGGIESAAAHLSIIRQGAESRGSREAGDRFGRSVAVGDFNGDGFADVATGSPGEDIGTSSNAGAVIINWSNRLGVQHAGAQLLTQASLNNDPEQAQAQFGFALAAGNFDNDAYDDLVVASPYYDAGQADAGAFWYFRGSASGLVAVTWQTQANVGGSNEAGDLFGYSLAVGDFNSDGNDDLAVGGPGEDGNAGAIFQFLGSAFGPIVNGGWFKQSTLGGTNGMGDYFGWSLAAGNMVTPIGTQYDDLAVGAPNKNNTAVTSGGVWVLRGSSSGLRSTSPLYYTAGSFDSQEAGAQFGYSLASGRFFGGSTDGLAVGEPSRTIGGHDNAGRVVYAKGGVAGLQFSTGNYLVQVNAGEVSEANDRFGYAVGAGDLDQVDAYQELMVGAPFEKVDTSIEAGFVAIFFGGPNGPTGQYGRYGLYQSTLNDPVTAGDEFGNAFASGVTDESGRSTIVAGASGDDTDRGMVHVFAPWRQVLNLGTKTSAVWNCEGEFVFTQKPFDEVCIASTTKIMTVLIACERSQLPVGNPKRLGLNNGYIIPQWVREIAGSQYVFYPLERTNLGRLLYCCLYPSGNDAAYAIADMLTGGDAVWTDHLTVVPEFVQEMNDRAAALGMTHTHFSNPAGLDLDGSHHSTAEDMLKLSRAAMENELFRNVASGQFVDWIREWEYPVGTVRTDWDGLSYGWLDNFQSWDRDGNGLKPGWTPCANDTRCFSHPGSLGRDDVLAATFGSSANEERNGADLIELGLAACGSPLTFSYQGRGHLGHMTATTGNGSSRSLTLPLQEELPGFALELFRQEGTGNTGARLEVERSQELLFQPGQTQSFGVRGAIGEHGEMVVRNLGTNVVSLEVDLPYSSPQVVMLDQYEKHVIPPHVGSAGPVWTVRNITGVTNGQSAHVMVSESYAWELTSIGTGADPKFSEYLLRQGRFDNTRVRIVGRDPNAGSSLYLDLHESGAVSGVGISPEPVTPDAPPVTALSASPNPFTSETRIAFTLGGPGDVVLSIHDIQGRQIVSITRDNLAAGGWTVNWDGRSSDSRPVVAGTYFYRVQVNGRTKSGKIVKVK